MNGSTDSSISYWLDRFDTYCKLNSLPDGESCKIIPFFLESSALIYYNEIPDNIKNNIKLLKDALCERFAPYKRYIDFCILSTKQEKYESVEVYLSRIFKLALDKNIPERLLLSVAINGLKPQLRKSVLLSQPKQLSELSRIAKLAEASEKGLNSSLESSYEILINELRDLKTHVTLKEPEVNAIKFPQINSNI